MDFTTIRARPASRRSGGNAPGASVAVILADSAPGPEVLLILRAEHPLDPWSGQMGLPGGRSEPQDADGLQTAIREVREETGIDLERSQCLGALAEVEPRSRDLPRLIIRPFVFAAASRPAVRPSSEVSGHWWVPLPALRDSEGTALVEFRGRRLKTPAYRVGPRAVWGLTHRILESLLEVVLPRPARRRRAVTPR